MRTAAAILTVLILAGCRPPPPPAPAPARYQFVTRADDLIMADTQTGDAWLFHAGIRTSVWIRLPNPIATNRPAAH